MSAVPLRILLTMIFCNAVWSAHPVMGKLLLLSFTAPQAAWLRYSSAWVSYLLATWFLGVPRIFIRLRSSDTPSRDAAWIFILGFSAFCFSPLLQLSGLAASHAMDNALIVAMEPLMTMLLAWFFLKEKLSVTTWLAIAGALVGFALLTDLSAVEQTHLLGNILLLTSLLGEAVYSLAGRKLIQQHAPTAVFGTALGVGVVLLTLAQLFFGGLPSWDSLSHMSWKSALGLLWLGPLGTGLSYFLWMRALTQVPVTSLALTLFIQPVLGPLIGALFLGEKLSGIQFLGCFLILGSVFFQSLLQARAVSNSAGA